MSSLQASQDQQPARAGHFKVTHRMVLMLALPMTIAYLTTPLLGLVDTAIAGRLGDAAFLGGLAIGAVIVDVIFTTFNFLRSGTTGLAAQALGKGDEEEKQAILVRALVIGSGSGLAVMALIPLILAAGLWFMAPGREVAEAASTYVAIRLLGSPFALANYALLGWLVGLGRSGLGLVLQIVLNGINALCSVMLGLWMGFGIAGIAMGTIIGEAVATIAGLAIAWRLADPARRPSLTRIRDVAALWRFANLNADIMLRSFVLLFAFAYFTAQGAAFGETTLAANAVLMNFFFIAGYLLDGLATAAEQIAGRAIGANDRAAFWRGVWLTMGWNSVVAGSLTTLLLVFGGSLVDLITTLEPVRMEARNYILLAGLTALTGVLAFQMDGIYIGATWSREMSIMMLLSAALYLLAWQLLEPLGNTGLWIALHIFLAARGITLAARLPVRARHAFAPVQVSAVS